ncbi:ROK family protein [Bacillus sp. 165]|uniref:ROK family protein n=1 Tax=Bacillus sp. 165 TaxID=1529117 RepID=UPI001ADCF94B|nr:ROK family protein [Bacillus sp. 165]
MKHYLAFDIGGTQIKYGIVSEEGKVVTSFQADTEAHKGGQSVVEKVIRLGNELMQAYSIEGIGISTLGLVDADNGVVLGGCENIPHYAGIQLKQLVSGALDVPVEVENDVNCVGLAESWIGAGNNVNNFIALTIGTGVGGAIIINGELYRGRGFSAGEWGYMIVEGKAFEHVASITGLCQLAAHYKGENVQSGKEVFDLYDQGDEKIKLAVQLFFKHLAIGISNLIYIFNPEKVIIGGGVTARGEVFVQELNVEIEKYLLPDFQKQTDIVLASSSNHAGMIGGVHHFINKQALQEKTQRNV